MTAPLYRAEVPLGLGLSAIVEIVEIDPEPAPESGAEWPVERDWPRARLTIALPAECGDLALALRSEELTLLGRSTTPTYDGGPKGLGYQWGRVDLAGTAAATQRRSVEDRAEYLTDAVSRLALRADAELAPLIAHVAKRAARLAQREDTLARGRASPQPQITTDVRPIDLSPPREVSPETHASPDDSSQRFALLELDVKPQRAKRSRKVA